MKCERADTLLPFFQDGTLEPGITRDVGDHLARCSRCREEYRKLEDMVSLARTALMERAFPFRAGYVTAVQEKIRKRKRERTLISWAVPIAAALFLTVSVSTSVFLFHDTGFSRSAGQTAHPSVATQKTSARPQGVDESVAINTMYHYSDVTLDDVMNRMDESELSAALESSER